MREVIIASILYGFEYLHQCGKRVKKESQKDLGANYQVCRSYRRQADRGLFDSPFLPQ